MMHANPLKEIVAIGAPPVPPYNRAVKGAGLIYLSGTLAQDDRGDVVGRGDVAAQTRAVLERMGDVLAAAGSSLDDVVAVTVYLTAASDFAAMNEAYRPFWRGDPPTRTTVIVDLVLDGALIEVSMVAAPRGAPRQVVRPAGWPASPNPYSYAIRTGDTLFMSGLVPRRGRDNTPVGGGIAAQTRAVMDNAAAILEAAGLSFAHVASARVYLTDAADFAGMNDAYREYFTGAPPPARATVQCGLAGAGFLVEMTFTASASPRLAAGAAPAGVPLSPAIRAGHRLYVSGMLGETAGTAGDARAQTEEALARIGRTLEAAGASPADVVDGLVYLTDRAFFDAMNEPYRAFFGGAFPARATVVTPLVVAGGLVEIVVTAVVG